MEFDSLIGVRIGGWITAPVNGKFRARRSREPWLRRTHGAGGADAATGRRFDFFPCARGFNRSAHLGLPKESSTHVLHGIDSRDTYIHRGCAADIWSAASVLCELYPEAARRLHYIGASFGGGIGALALAWDNRVQRAFLDVPSFGNHPLRVTLPCTGSGAAVRTYYEQHPEVLNVLAYFDSATAARHIKIPVLVAAALFDPAVPPPGQFAVYNALAGPQQLFVRRAAHFAYPGQAKEEDEVSARLWRWFGQ